jgi:hypothetical protein
LAWAQPQVSAWAGLTLDVQLRDNYLGSFSDMQARVFLWGHFGGANGFPGIPAPPYGFGTGLSLLWGASETATQPTAPAQYAVTNGGSWSYRTGYTGRVVPPDAPDDTGFAVGNISTDIEWQNTSDGTPLGFPTTVPDQVAVTAVYKDGVASPPYQIYFTHDQTVDADTSSGFDRFVAYYRL